MVNIYIFFYPSNIFLNNTFINLLIKYRAFKMKFSQFPQIIAYNIIIYISITNYNFRRNHNIEALLIIENKFCNFGENNVVFVM